MHLLLCQDLQHFVMLRVQKTRSRTVLILEMIWKFENCKVINYEGRRLQHTNKGVTRIYDFECISMMSRFSRVETPIQIMLAFKEKKLKRQTDIY